LVCLSLTGLATPRLPLLYNRHNFDIGEKRQVVGFLFVIIGVAAIAVGIFGKNLKFYIGELETGHEKRSSTWSGRLLFFIVGFGFLALGIKFLVEL